uniref:Uncharacterized protein n=1 Tax=Cacopsylla melanoneura TaxID=428564 RepID=A0A8D8SML2_9HEMI
MVHLYRWYMFSSLSCLSLALILTLWQITLSSESLTVITFSKYFCEFMGIAAWYYYLCHCSDLLDDCQIKLSRALYNSHWYQCTSRTQKDLIVFLRRVQQPNLLVFNRGFSILNKALFVRAAKSAYSFVSFIRAGK